MPQPNIVYLPGIFGSRIGSPPAFLFPGFDVWISPYTALTGILLQLQLAADGVSPGPLTRGVAWQPTGILEITYGPLSRFMQARGWNVVEAAYDWRLSILNSAAAVLSLVQTALGSNPFVFVCHSMGGLVARAVYGLLVNAGAGQQVQGLVTLGTPHFGSWEIVRGFYGLPQLYQQLAHVAGVFGPFLPSYRPGFLDAILASWPGWYEMLPFLHSGPLALSNPAVAQSLYQVGTYAGGNPYVSQNRLSAAPAVQDFLFPAFPPGKTVCIRGRGWRTAFMTNAPNPLSNESGYAYTNAGDSQVTQDESTLQGATLLDVAAYHARLPLDTNQTWQAVVWAVRSLVGPGA
jgi:pimeloyl-ACP methyl ester carboxylesterase